MANPLSKRHINRSAKRILQIRLDCSLPFGTAYAKFAIRRRLNRMKRPHHILFIGLLFCLNQLFSQNDSLKSRIYSDFINQSVSDHDSLSKKASRLILASFIKKMDLSSNIDLEYLRDYLAGNIYKNDIYKILNDKFGLKPISYFYHAPWGNFGELLAKDSAFGYMLLDLDKLLSKKSKLNKHLNIRIRYDLKYTSGKIPKGSDDWDRFYNKNVNCYGIIKLSDILISGNFAVFYRESYHYSLYASGDLVFMEYRKNKWRIIQYINIWIS